MNEERNLVSRAIIIFTVLFTVLFSISFLHLRNEDELSTTILFVLILVFLIGLSIAIYTVVYISNEYKKDLKGFTPYEIGMLYSEYKSLIEQLSEGVISVDKEFKIITLNEQFKRMYNLSDHDKGKIVYEVFPHIDFKTIMTSKNRVHNKLTEIFDEKILLTTFPLYVDGQVIGATAIIRSRYEVDKLIDQISGYRKISKALREQKHEFQNKLHVILGLIKMKDFEKVNNYITENVYTTNLTSDFYSSRIKDDKVTALFVGKEIQSKEYDTTIRLTDESFLSRKHKSIDSDDLVIVIGNLIDNAFEAYGKLELDNKKVTVRLLETDDQILIGVSDHAGGIDPTVKERMFKRGVSTKDGDSRGTGLSLVNEIVNLYSGSKQVQSSKLGTYIEIILKKVTE
jgi:sensor histidine kinase regulating citrate/malate metabolism